MNYKDVIKIIICYFFRVIFLIIAVLLLVWFIIPIPYGITNSGNILGIIICSLYIIWALHLYIFGFLRSKIKQHKIGRIILKIIYIIIAIALVYSFVVSGFMIYKATTPPTKDSTVVVLGCKVNGTSPSLMLANRLNTAYNYLQKNPQSICIVTGGKGHDEVISESECMFTYLVNKGIDYKRIYKEDKATNTNENIKFSNKIIKENNLNTDIAIVTDEFHQLRASIIAHKNNVTSIGAISSSTPILFLPTYWVRELIAVPVEIIK